MPLSVRDFGLECVAHLGTEVTLDAGMPTGARGFLLGCLNRAMQKLRSEAPSLFKQTIGLEWTPAVTGTVNVTQGSTVVTMGTLAAPDDGCSVRITGDASMNELRAAADQDGTYLLLHAYSGPSGTADCTAYGDSVLLDTTVDSVVGGMLLHERRPLDILRSREEWMQYQRGRWNYDYGIGTGLFDLMRQIGIPRGVWVESFLDPEGSAIQYRARCAPMPSGTFRATLEVLGIAREAQDDDFNVGADAYLPVPGGRDGLLRAVAMYLWSGSPWFKNDSARPVIAQDYKEAIEQLRSFTANAGAGVRIVVRP